MPTVADILDRLGRTAPEASAASWDPTGLQLGDPTATVHTIAVCHEVTPDVMEAVETAPPDLLVTYHPLLFRPTTRLVAGRSPIGRAWRLVTMGVALAVAHTSFDGARGGTSDAAADALGLTDVRPFGPTGPAAGFKIVTFVPSDAVDAVVRAMTVAGAGGIGNYSGCHFRSTGTGGFAAREGADPVVGEAGTDNTVDEIRVEMYASASVRDGAVAALVAAHPYEEPAFDVYETVSNERFIGRVGLFAGSWDELVERSVGLGGGAGTRVTRTSGRAARVAVVPGSGGSFIGAAGAAGADVLVTGDVDHHRAAEARDRGLGIIDPGHAATERPGMSALRDRIGELCPDADVVDLTGFDPAPWL